MSIRQLGGPVAQFGSVAVCLIEMVDDQGMHATMDKTVDYEVSCEARECARYACTHLSYNDAIIEMVEHGTSVHGLIGPVVKMGGA